jgi:protein-S-isoprenylcysteine O-methyltransferase Ste14
MPPIGGETMTAIAPGPNKTHTRAAARALPAIAAYLLILTAILLFASGRWDWAMGWAYMAMYGCLTLIGTLVVPLDPGLVEERTHIKEGVKGWDKSITAIGSLLYPLAILIVAGLDARFGWSPRFAVTVQIAALVIAAAGNLTSVWAMAVNRFYSRFVRIQKERGHTPISDGPYRYVRHPGYLGQMVFSLASGPALGSLWTLIPGGLFALLLAVRAALEDKMLREELEGYEGYAQRVRYRLIPGIW